MRNCVRILRIIVVSFKSTYVTHAAGYRDLIHLIRLELNLEYNSSVS